MGFWAWPVPSSSRISSPFGPRRSPGGIGSTNHQGIDIAERTGAPIIASRPGRVIQSGWRGGFGNTVEIDHGGGWRSLYAHNSLNLVSVGQVVPIGHRIALVGSTGNSTGPHLHFEVRLNGRAMNPTAAPVSVRFANTVANTSSAAPPLPGNAPGGGNAAAPARVEITSVVVSSVTGTTGTRRESDLRNVDSAVSHGCEILIQNRRNDILLPVVEGEITLDYARRGSPGTLKFNVVNDDILDFHEGNPVRFRVDGQNVFYGYVFKKSRVAPGDVISVTCYDQIRYLKNEDTMVYSNLTYSALLRQIAQNYNLATGEIEDTGFVIAKRVEEGSLLDILTTAAELTLLNTGNLFVLFDDFGRLSLKKLEAMRLPILIDRDTLGDFTYTTSIDDETYNRIILAQDNDLTGQRELFVANEPVNQSRWGILQYYENLSNATPQVLRERANVLLRHYNRKTRQLRLKDCFGDARVRGGSSVAVHMGLGDMVLRNFMIVERVQHRFSNNQHMMDLTVAGGGGFVG